MHFLPPVAGAHRTQEFVAAAAPGAMKVDLHTAVSNFSH
jgi:hypothetical protein